MLWHNREWVSWLSCEVGIYGVCVNVRVINYHLMCICFVWIFIILELSIECTARPRNPDVR